ncbi:GNAT family N-acetyltransferase [Gordonia sputi]|uniref:N-acetylglutamate synthase, CG3035 family n=1 Tax=Gordonia sputi TaxID=36823 RepID=UPI0020446080|nr:GNAT family N-acetyltransferase [Gordonia sputi]MCM3895165.1 GNAT family N-acetyltransferase [Gordonia sputi]
MSEQPSSPDPARLPPARLPPARLPTDAYPGDRVVVRYLLGDASPADWRHSPNPAPASTAAPTMSDVTGFLVERPDTERTDTECTDTERPDTGDLDSTLLIERDGTVESIPRGSVVSIRLLSAQPVRNSAIRDLEHAAALAWPGVESTWIDGWLARAGAGFSRRANSAVPLDRSARADAPTLRTLASWYAERDLPVLLALPERLIAARTVGGEPASPTIHILTRDLDDFPEVEDDFPGMATGLGTTAELDVELAPTPSTRWAQSYSRGRDTDLVAAVVGSAEGPVTFATVVDESGTLIATGRAAVTSSPSGVAWLGITALWTDPSHRRRHIADAVLTRLMTWGTTHNAQSAYVQVEADNVVAGRWYRRRGFALHHTSHYESIA